MSYESRVGLCNEVAIDSEILAECVGGAVARGLADGVGEGGGLAFCGGLTTAGGGVVVWTFSFSEGSLVSSGKRCIFGTLRRKVALLVTSLPFTRISRLTKLAT